MDDITKIVESIDRGDARAAERLLPLVYDELRRLAAVRLSRELPGQTLQPTALVHEAYLRLVGESNTTNWDGRGHFFAAAAEAMRRILIENARRRDSQKRGGGWKRAPLDAATVAASQPSDDVVALSDALDKLAETDPEAVEVVKLRYFAGLSLEETARILGLSPRTADRRWAYARAWLHQELHGD